MMQWLPKKLSHKLWFSLGIIIFCVTVYAGLLLSYGSQIEIQFHRVLAHTTAEGESTELHQLALIIEDHINNQVLLIRWGVILLISLVTILGWIFIKFTVMRPVHELIGKFRRLAEGEQNIEFRTARTDELGELGACFNEMNINLNQAMEAWELLTESQSATQAIIEAAHDAIITFDDKNRINVFNQAAEKIFTLEAMCLQGKSIFQLIAPSSHSIFSIHIDLAHPEKHQTRHIFECLAQHADGTTFPAELTLTGVMQKGSPVYILYLSDISDRKLYESELKRSRQAALDIAQAKADFLANISHEIRTPMNGILGMLSVIDHSRYKSAELQEYIDAATESAHDMMALINNLVDFANLDSGQLKLKSLDFSLTDLIKRLAQLCRIKANTKNLDLNLDLQISFDAIRTDPVRLGQILKHLLDNAVKFTEQGAITLRTQQRLRQTGQIELHIQISDTGPGIDPNNMDKIFDAFTQADGSIIRKQGGTGIGLAFCKQTLDLMGGKIHAESFNQQGSTFSITLPVLPAHDSSQLQDVSRLEGLESIATTANVSVINQRQFNSLKKLLPAAEFSVLLKSFDMDCREYLQQLRNAFAQSQSTQLKSITHNLRASCSNIYADAMLSACQQFETSIHQNNRETSNQLLSNLEIEYERLRTLLMEYGLTVN